MSDQLFDGRHIRILMIVDAFSRLSPAIDVRQSYRGADGVETLERVTRARQAADQSGGQWSGIHLQDIGSVGLPERRDPGLF